MNRRISKANSITTYDTATLWRALEASSANHQNQIEQKETARRWQRAANRLLRQNTVTSTSSPIEHLSSFLNEHTTSIGALGVSYTVFICFRLFAMFIIVERIFLFSHVEYCFFSF
jgi:hypothetical protein